MTAALEGGEWSAARPGRTSPPGKTRYPLYRRRAGLDGRKISSPPGFDPGPSSPQSVAIPTELPGPSIIIIIIIIIRNLNERDQSGDLDVNGRVISKWLLI